ncbi:MAG: tRNA glutamyl-Q(34) synthetase GluQRS [Gammaproteobacteria bacterium]|jgi:glutamyl-Q tRNA(Asp) synthetase|nr:tRNA glutamyl-Q(34) synthetase GluQRS [Gammaproteobacteria bacterium]
MPADSGYRGRFAPSPTGPLHFGSLVAAVASYADAISNSGEWLVRIEDLDPTREQPGAAELIVESLVRHGMVFSEPVRQSERSGLYGRAMQTLLAADAAYPCSCSRKKLTREAAPGIAGLIYPGTCRRRPAPPGANAVRFKCDSASITYQDEIQGLQHIALGDQIGDFLLRRGDGYFAYQLAVAVDDHAQGITHVLRGTDLLLSTFMQIAVLRKLALEPPRYGHFPVVRGPDGRKLSKQNRSTPLNNKICKNNILNALIYLKHDPPRALKSASLTDIWSWVAQHWTLSKLYAMRSDTDKGYD